jgi:prepilin-type N-terminal cleavage/methylation domain-containing protein
MNHRAPIIHRDERGLTLIEVLIAVAITLVGLVALIGVMPLALSHIGQSNWRTTAVFLAQERLEQVKDAVWSCSPLPYVDSVGLSNPATNAPTGTVATCPPPPPLTVTGATAVVTFSDEGYNTIPGHPTYRRQVRVQDCGAAPGCGGVVLDSGLRQVTVSVFFWPQTGTGTLGTAEDAVDVTTTVALRQ